MKFLVLWRLDLGRVSMDVAKAVLSMAEYAAPLERSGKVIGRYHVVGAHGGAWIYDVASNDELEVLLARSPVYNFAHYEVFPLADMAAPPVRGPETRES